MNVTEIEDILDSFIEWGNNTLPVEVYNAFLDREVLNALEDLLYEHCYEEEEE